MDKLHRLKHGPQTENSRCAWQFIGEDTSGYLFWCKTCGRICDDESNYDEPSSDLDSIYCPDTGNIP